MPKTLLVVDDDPDLCRLSKEYLEILIPEIQIVTTTSAQKAIEITKSQSINYIMSDFMMPDMNGIELLENIRRVGFEIPFIILTGHPIEMISPLAEQSGAVACFSKNSSLNCYNKIVDMIM